MTKSFKKKIHARDFYISEYIGEKVMIFDFSTFENIIISKTFKDSELH